MPKIESAGVPVPVAPVVDPFDVPISEETRIFRKYGLKPRAQAEKYTPPKNTDPHYLPGQIVYLIPNPARTPNEHNPFIGSPYEIDCKVLSTYKIAGELNYHLVSGIGATFEATHDFLTSPKNKGKYKTNEFFTLNEDIGICNKGINFNRVGEYYSNDYHGIFIHHSRFDQIIHLFTKHLINE